MRRGSLVEVFEQLGEPLTAFARRARLGITSVRRALAGRPVTLGTFDRLARALGIERRFLASLVAIRAPGALYGGGRPRGGIVKKKNGASPFPGAAPFTEKHDARRKT